VRLLLSEIFQTWKKYRDYCCSIGMRLASFPTMERYQDAFNTVKHGDILYSSPKFHINLFYLPENYVEIYFDETYANGDGSDSWCTTNELIPLELYSQKTYPSPACGTWSCFVGEMKLSVTNPFLIFVERNMCNNRDLSTGYLMHLLCMP
jgi:hypothetical protein